MSEDKRKDAQSGSGARGEDSADNPSAGARGGSGSTADSGQSKPGKAEPAKAEPNKAEPNKAASGKPEPGKPEPGKSESGKGAAGTAAGKANTAGSGASAKSGGKAAPASDKGATAGGQSKPKASSAARGETPRGKTAAADRGAPATGTAPDRNTSKGSAGDTTSTGAGAAAAGAGASSDGGGTPDRPAAGRANGGGSGGTARIIAIVALVVAAIAVVLAGWVWYQGQQRLASHESRLSTVEKGLESSVQDIVEPKLDEFGNRIGSVREETRQTRERVDALAGDLEGVRENLKATQSRIASLAERQDSTGNRWALRQIESLLQAANRRLQLYNDPEGARTALEMASDAIGRMSDPRLFEIREAVVDEIAALKALPDPDVEGLALELSSMMDRVADLPLAADVPTEYQPESAEAGDSESSDGPTGIAALDDIDFSQGWAHFKDSMSQALSGMLTIRRADGTQRALLPPDQVFFLSQNLQLQLRSAQLALLERNTESYRESLASAKSWLEEYYDTDASAVSGLIDQLEQMRNVELDWNPPDISTSLIRLRDLMDGRGESEETDTSSDSSAATDAEAGGDSAGDEAGEGSQ